MIFKIGLALLGLLALFLLYVAAKPKHSRIVREVLIAAPAGKVFPYVNERALANSWNPWLKQDPEAKLTLSGPESGVGSKTSWEGGKKLGMGTATVIESVPNQRVTVQLDYLKPFEMSQQAFYTLESLGNQTKVTWGVEGESPFLSRLMCTFMNMDRMVGNTFQEGLAELKRRIELSAGN